MRSYTVKELDELRNVVEDRCLFGTCIPGNKGRVSRQFSKGELEREVEEKVRTHILVGHLAQDLAGEDLRRASATETPHD